MVVDKRKGWKFSLLNEPPKQKQSNNSNQQSFSSHFLTSLQVVCTWRANVDNVAVFFSACVCSAILVTESLRVFNILPRFGGQKGVWSHSPLEARYQLCCWFLWTCAVEQVRLRRQLAPWRRPTVGSRPLGDSILTTISQRGKPWTTLLGEGRSGIASRPFG